MQLSTIWSQIGFVLETAETTEHDVTERALRWKKALHASFVVEFLCFFFNMMVIWQISTVV